MCGVKDDLKSRARDIRLEVVVFVGIFVLASLVGALIWKASVDLPRWTQAGTAAGGIEMGPIPATKTIGIDAIYLFISVPMALLLGAGLAYWRRRTPTLTVVLIALASLLAAALMERFGLWFGPADPANVLKHAAVGATAPVRLQVQATGVLMAWPAAAMLGALLILLVLPTDTFDEDAASESDTLSALPTL